MSKRGDNPTNAYLTLAVANGRATQSEARNYANRVSRRSKADVCLRGHPDCALVKGGPCLYEVEAGIEGAAA